MLQESILQCFRLLLSYHLSLRPLFYLFLSDHLRQVLLYITGSLFYSVQIMTICRYYHLGDSCIQSKKKGKDQEPIQSSTKPDPMDTNGKVTTSQLDITNEGQEVSPFPAGDHKASINRRRRKHNKNKTEII